MKYILYTCVVLLGFTAVEVAVISTVTFSLPNKINFYRLDDLRVFVDLFWVSPVAAIELQLIQKPLIIIQKVNVSDGAQLWGVYIMPISMLVWFVFSVFILQIKKISHSMKVWKWLGIAAALFIASVFYLRIQSCCTETPLWVFDVMILSRVFNPLLNSMFWQEVYLSVSPWFETMQLAILAMGVVILYKSYVAVKNK